MGMFRDYETILEVVIRDTGSFLRYAEMRAC